MSFRTGDKIVYFGKLRFTSADGLSRLENFWSKRTNPLKHQMKKMEGYSHTNVYFDVSWPIAIHSTRCVGNSIIGKYSSGILRSAQ